MPFNVYVGIVCGGALKDFHRVLKSGCGVEQIAHETAERIRRAIAINLVIAWRIMLMTLLGRETPELPPEVLFSDIELQVLRAYAKKNASHHLQLCGKKICQHHEKFI